MSSMLEQAIVDAAALREAALKNAEHSIIEKYAPEIKAAVQTLLGESWAPRIGESVLYQGAVHRVTTESDNGQIGIQQESGKTFLVNESDLQEADETLLQEEDMDMVGSGAASYEPPGFEKEIPLGAAAEQEMCPCPDDDAMINFEFSLDDLMKMADQDPNAEAEPREGAMSDMAPAEEEEEEDPLAGLFESNQMEDIMNVLNELDEAEEDLDEDIELQEELVVDMGAEKNGTFETNQATLKYQQEMELAKEESDKYKEENEVLEKRLEELEEGQKQLGKKTELYETTIYKLNEKLQSTLLSNAKLLYSNRVLSDASLNERQKSKIVEAINKARSVEEAKTLQETLKTTVGSTKSSGPQSLSESVQRRSNLSSMLNNKRHETPQEDNFSERMKRLAGLK